MRKALPSGPRHGVAPRRLLGGGREEFHDAASGSGFPQAAHCLAF